MNPNLRVETQVFLLVSDDVGSLSAWCKDNDFDEDHAHTVRSLVRDPRLLSKIEP